MNRNATQRFSNTSVLSVSAVEAPVVVTSDSIDDRLSAAYERVGLRRGLLERLAGIRERRWWPEDVTFIDGAAMAGEKAISESGVDPASIGLMVNTSVSRRYLEPSTAVAVHAAIGLPPSCQNFDVTNACLGFINGMQLAAAMIDAGHIEYALVVNGESARDIQERTIERLNRPGTTASDVVDQFATLTLGSGAVAMVLGPADRHPEGHRLVGSASRAGTEHHELCVGDNDMMRTDLKGLLTAGVALSEATWADAVGDFGWEQGISRYYIHQVSQVHTDAVCERLGLDTARVPRSFPTHGNIGPASVPFTLARDTGNLEPGDRALLMGIGSGLNASCLEITW